MFTCLKYFFMLTKTENMIIKLTIIHNKCCRNSNLLNIPDFKLYLAKFLKKILYSKDLVIVLKIILVRPPDTGCSLLQAGTRATRF